MRWNLAAAALAAAWGFIAVLVAHVSLPAETLVFWRLAIAAVATLVLVLALRRPALLRVPRGLRVRVALAGATLGLHWLAFFETIKLSSVAVALVTVCTAPLFLAVLAPSLLHERRSVAALWALLPGAAGIALVALAGGGGGGALRPLALATGLLGGLTYALLVVQSKHLAYRLPAPTLALWTYVAAALCLAPGLAFADRILPSGGETGYVLLLGVVFTAGSGIAYVVLLRHVTAQAMGVLAYLEPVTGAVLAWALLGQPLPWGVAAGGVLVLVAGAIVVVLEPEGAVPLEAPAGSDPRMLDPTRQEA